MQICRYRDLRKGARLGYVHEGRVYDLTAAAPDHMSSMASLLAHPDLAEELHRVQAGILSQENIAFRELDCPPEPGRPHLLAPADRQEIWAAGVTYFRSRTARMEESKAAASHYDRLYDAPRPELFFKATPHRTVGPNAPVRIRSDASWNVPEPELALAIGPDLRLVGFTIGNDMSSRDIEGANPLYLPQAKMYLECCALGPVITLAEAVPDPCALDISLTVARRGRVVFAGNTSTSQLKRGFGELIEYLGRDNAFPDGVFLLTGTGVVPPNDFTLEEDDFVSITIDAVGTLRNPVRRGGRYV